MAIRQLDKYAAPQVHRGGLSSREGLALLIHDGFKEGKQEIEPIHDKRLWVIESEFANVLGQTKREGNTLSAALRDVWDGISIRPATKSSRVWATDPHIALSGAVTPGELRALLASRELTNGFANRFMMIWAERDKLLPFPQATPQEVVNDLAGRTLQVIEFAGGTRPAEKNMHCVTLSPAAARLYRDLYLGELNAQGAGDLVAALTERRAPMLLRLAMLFALCDESRQVDIVHIEAAMAWVRYSLESVTFVFASSIDEAGAAEVSELAGKIVSYLESKGRATRTDITGRVLPAAPIARQDRRGPRRTAEHHAASHRCGDRCSSEGSPGSPTKFYQLAAKPANSANSTVPCGPAQCWPVSEAGELCEVLATTVRTLRPVHEQPHQAAGRADSDDSLDSHSSREADDEGSAT